MKRTLLSMLVAFVCIVAQAQVVTYVTAPASLEGGYETSWAQPSSGWSTPNMLDPANAIEDTLVFVNDGTSGDSLGCNPLINNIAGKIAVIYRGDCEFGQKSLNAQNAGAIGVVIINNVPGSPISMGGGAVGTSVTIPVVMITDVDGALLKSEIAAGNVTAYIGAKNGFFANDVGFKVSDILMPRSSSIPHLLAQDDSEWSVKLGGWVRNFGNQAQSSVTLNADITQNGSSIYNQTSNPVNLNPGDSVFVTLPDFSQPVYTAGYYEVTYAVSMGGTDEFPEDNSLTPNFLIGDSIFSYAPIADSTRLPTTTVSYRSSNAPDEFTSCIHFQDANASRMEATGVSVTASGGPNDVLTAEITDVKLYEWQDQFTGLTDANLAFNNLIQVEYGTYTYLSDLQNERIYIPFDNPIRLKDGMRYLFCFTTYSPDTYHGHNTNLDYIQNWMDNDQPTTVVYNPSTMSWFSQGFGSEIVSSIGAVMQEWTNVGIEEKETSDEIKAYPNPVRDMLSIPYGEINGDAVLSITDMTGKQIQIQNLNLDGSGQLQVDVSDISAGMYLFNLQMEDGQNHSFKVMIGR